MTRDRAAIVLEAVLRTLRPAVRLLLQNGVSYGALATALKRVFLDAAQDELAARGMARTDSAITLLSGVHRRDVRTLLRAPAAVDDDDGARRSMSMASEVVGRWLTQPPWIDGANRPRRLPRGPQDDGFDALVASVSSDIRPRAVLDELKRLGVADEGDDAVWLVAEGFAPRRGFEETSWLITGSLHDHWAAAARNLQDDRNLLEQSVHVDQISEASAQALHKAAASAWRQAHRDVLRLAQQRFDADAAAPDPGQRTHRARFGVYFWYERDDTTNDRES